ncbi:MAG: glycine--tRNA ligase subunit beta, partial [Candidatus Riflebacteria bacterium]|nr:glycine--tRNA ligase subunit beta [Candidatus Riflebacteria bacterium]
MPRNLLLETGFTCLPNDAFGYDLPDFRNIFSDVLRQEKVEFGRVRCWVSQYRVAVLVEGLADAGNTLVKEIRGPKVSAAFDYNNQALPAANGFAAAQGLALKDLVTREVDGEKFLFAVKKVAGQSLEDNLVKIQKSLLAAIPFYLPGWRAGSLFPQPPLYFTAWLDDQPLNIELEGLKSIKATASHQGASITFHELTGIGSFLQMMNDLGLMAEPGERKKILETRIRSLLPEGYRLRADSQRLQRYCLFSESLHPILIKINPAFNAIPESVFSRYLTMNTEYLPCEDTHGKL